MANNTPATGKPAEDNALLEKMAKQAEKSQTAQIMSQEAEIARLKAELEKEKQQNSHYRAGNDFAVVEQAIRDALEKGIDPWDVFVSVRVPERRDTNEKSYWFMINGRSVQLPANNQYQEMRLPFAETLMNMIRADKYAQNFADNEIQVYDPIMNPHKDK